MGSQNDGDPKDTKAPRRSRLFEVSPPPETEASAAVPASEPPAEEAPVQETPVDDAAAEPLTEPIVPIASEDIHSIDSASVAPVEDASDASIKLARDARLKKPVSASTYLARSKGGEVLVRRSAPAVDLHPAPSRRGVGWLWAIVVGFLVVLVLGWLYAAGYTIGPEGLVPPPHAATR